jgi:multidrug efflux pump
MIGVTAFGLFLTPVFYVALRRLAGNRPLQQHGSHTAPLTEEVGFGAVARPVLAAPRGSHE